MKKTRFFKNAQPSRFGNQYHLPADHDDRRNTNDQRNPHQIRQKHFNTNHLWGSIAVILALFFFNECFMHKVEGMILTKGGRSFGNILSRVALLPSGKSTTTNYPAISSSFKNGYFKNNHLSVPKRRTYSTSFPENAPRFDCGESSAAECKGEKGESLLTLSDTPKWQIISEPNPPEKDRPLTMTKIVKNLEKNRQKSTKISKIDKILAQFEGLAKERSHIRPFRDYTGKMGESPFPPVFKSKNGGVKYQFDGGKFEIKGTFEIEEGLGGKEGREGGKSSPCPYAIWTVDVKMWKFGLPHWTVDVKAPWTMDVDEKAPSPLTMEFELQLLFFPPTSSASARVEHQEDKYQEDEEDHPHLDDNVDLLVNGYRMYSQIKTDADGTSSCPPTTFDSTPKDDLLYPTPLSYAESFIQTILRLYPTFFLKSLARDLAGSFNRDIEVDYSAILKIVARNLADIIELF